MPPEKKQKTVPPDLPKSELLKILSNISKRVKKEAFERGLSITIAKNGNIYRLHPDNTLEFVEKLPVVKRKNFKKNIQLIADSRNH